MLRRSFSGRCPDEMGFSQGLRLGRRAGQGRPSGSDGGGWFQGSVREMCARACVLRLGAKRTSSRPKNLTSSMATKGPPSKIVSHPDLRSGCCTFTLPATAVKGTIGRRKKGFSPGSNLAQKVTGTVRAISNPSHRKWSRKNGRRWVKVRGAGRGWCGGRHPR